MEHMIAIVLFCGVVHLPVLKAIIDLHSCGDCTDRADVPCVIQEIPFPCPHGEFRDVWPGPPRDLAVEQVFSMDPTWPWMANFTWKPPYDASISSLTGFFMTVNTLVINVPFVHHPKCFFANLSGTDWASVKDPYSVLFHFDCVRVQMKTSVHMLLTSSPVPHESPPATEAEIHLGLPATDSKKMNITYDVSHSNVKVMFEPSTPDTRPDTSYFVCLSQHKYHYRSCDKSINTTQSPVTFTGVKRDNYTIMIKPSTENSLFYATGFFYVPGSPEAEKPYLDFTILSIIMACLIFVTMATTLAFCIMRKQERCMPACITRCKEKGLYQPTPTNIPNNAQDEPECTEIYVVCLENEPEQFVEAVDSITEFLTRWGSCHINKDICGLLQNRGNCQVNRDTLQDKKFIFCISYNMVDRLKDITDGFDDAEVSVQNRFIARLLKEDLLLESQKICVSFHSNISELEDSKILSLTKLIEGKSRPDIGLHMDNVHQLLKKIDSTNLDLTRSWSESPELTNMLAKMKTCLSYQTDEERNMYMSNGHLSDHGYESRVTEEGQGYGDVTPPDNLVQGDDIANQMDMNDRNVRLQDTQRWAESQSQIRSPYGSQFYQSQNPTRIEYHKRSGINTPATYLAHEGRGYCNDTNYNPKAYVGEVTGIRLPGNRKELSPLEDMGSGPTQLMDWVPPFDDDTESVSFSVICERQQELNDNYMHNMTAASRI